MVYVDFKVVKAAVSIEDAANLLKLKLNTSKTQLRGACPGCSNGDERILVINLADIRLASHIALAQHSSSAHAAKLIVPCVVWMVFANPSDAKTKWGSAYPLLTGCLASVMARICLGLVTLVLLGGRTLRPCPRAYCFFPRFHKRGG
jgi:hypothetical protein